MNKDTRLPYLLEQYMKDAISETEKAELFSYIDDPAYETELKDLLSKAFEKEGKLEMEDLQQTEMLQSIYTLASTDERSKRTRKLWPRIATAAAIGLILISVGLFYNPNFNNTVAPKLAYNNDASPGINSATLTLADGNTIKLSEKANGQLAEEGGVRIRKTASGEVVYEITNEGSEKDVYHTLSTANGETYRLILPDGSKVWLNSASKLTFNTSIKEGSKREVELSGEAYFEIAKSYDKIRRANRPFIVTTDKQQVEVLGTHFNVNSYADESYTATTLIEGSVKVTSNIGDQILKPGQQSVADDRSLKVYDVNTENIIDWKNGDFVLNNQNFKTALRKIARWYDVEIIYDSSIPDDIESGGWISRNAKLSAVLKSIESTGQVKFRVENKKIYVSKY